MRVRSRRCRTQRDPQTIEALQGADCLSPIGTADTSPALQCWVGVLKLMESLSKYNQPGDHEHEHRDVEHQHDEEPEQNTNRH